MSTADRIAADDTLARSLDKQRGPIVIDGETRGRLIAFLHRPDVPRGMGYTAFIEWALAKAETQLDVCTDDGSGECQTHIGGYRPDEDSPCDLGGM